MTHVAAWRIVAAATADRAALEAHVLATWGGDAVATRDKLLRPADHPGFVAVDDSGRILGHAAWRQEEDDSAYLVAIDAQPPGAGIGSALLAAVEAAARSAGCDVLRLDTTNDNLDALAFYQRRGYRLVALRPGAVDEARRTLKSSIPTVGSSGIPMRDELTLEKTLGPRGDP